MGTKRGVGWEHFWAKASKGVIYRGPLKKNVGRGVTEAVGVRAKEEAILITFLDTGTAGQRSKCRKRKNAASLDQGGGPKTGQSMTALRTKLMKVRGEGTGPGSV